MKKYIVGGFTRDKLMGLTPKDKDYVLVGCKERDVKHLLNIGYQQVGKDFPVFLSPQGDEYALARVERKIGNGYGGFCVETEGVTLEQDLFRRDLTMNAIAYDVVKREYIDPYNGIQDIKDKLIRHVSNAFSEDPLRVLRLARFKARYNFNVHPTTVQMIRQMVSSGELNHLTSERIFLEVKKAFEDTISPDVDVSNFFSYLNDIGAMEVLVSTPLTKVLIDNISKYGKYASSNAACIYTWSDIIDDSSDFHDDVVGQVKMTNEVMRFNSFMSKFKDSLVGFRKLNTTEIAQLFIDMNFHNRTEDFLFLVMDYLYIRNEIDLDLYDLLVKSYDLYIETKMPDIQMMLTEKSITPPEIAGIKLKTYTEQFEKMFAKK